MTEFLKWIETAGQYVIQGPGGVIQAETWNSDVADAIVAYLTANPDKRYTAAQRHDDIDRASPMGLCGMDCRAEAERARLIDQQVEAALKSTDASGQQMT